MSKLARVLVLGAMVAAMTLAGMTVAQAQTSEEGKDVRRPPTEGQVGETWRKRPVTSQQQTAADAAARRQLAQERSSVPGGTPAPEQVDEPSGQPGWLVLGFAVTAALALVVGLAVMGASRQAARCGPDRPHHHGDRQAVPWGCRAHPAAPSAIQVKLQVASLKGSPLGAAYG